MSYYRNPYAGTDEGRYRPVYPYGEPATPPLGMYRPAPEHQRLLPEPENAYHRGETLTLPHHHRSETLPMHHLDSLGRRTNPRRKVAELDLQAGPQYRESLLQQRSSPPTLRRAEAGGVRLTPGWESRNVPVDELNFRTPGRQDTHYTAVKEEIEDPANYKTPKDRCSAVYMILLLHGIGVLLSWNVFITAKSYFEDYKLSPNMSTGDEATSYYRKNFLSYHGVAAQVPNVLCNGINLFFQVGGGSPTCRLVTSILIEVIVFITTVVLAMVDSSSWPGTFFYVTLACVVVLNMASGVYQNSIYGVAAKLPMRYTNALVIGSNLCGTITSVFSILSIFASPSLKTAAIYYFLGALFILLICFDTYFALPLSRYYRHYERLAKKAAAGVSQGMNSRPPYWSIFKQTWPQCFNVFFVFFVTLSIFPAVQADVRAVDNDFIIIPKYFSQATCYLNFNFFAMVGNIFSNWVRKPSPRFLWLPVLLRALLIPFFMLCNYKPEERVLPVLIDQDWAYIGVGAFLGWSSGYFSSLAMMYAPKCVQPQHAACAGMMAAFFLVLGIFAGINFSIFISWLVETRLF